VHGGLRGLVPAEAVAERDDARPRLLYAHVPACYMGVMAEPLVLHGVTLVLHWCYIGVTLVSWQIHWCYICVTAEP
jgi:hypothetical protein